MHLTVGDLARSTAFYEQRLGLRLHARDETTARLGAGGADLVVLRGRPGSRRVPGTAGLYHFAVLVPSRLELARSLRRLIDTATPLQGASDHGVSEALYLADPDGHGIEIYRDRAREEWPRDRGELRMGIDPLDIADLLDELEPTRARSASPSTADAVQGLDPRTTIGHMHLHVANLADAEAFYGDLVGFDVTQRYGRGATFMSAGGYHHHLGLNTWAGVGVPPAPEGSLGLHHFVVRLPSGSARSEIVSRLRSAGVPHGDAEEGVVVRDPSGNALVLAA